MKNTNQTSLNQSACEQIRGQMRAFAYADDSLVLSKLREKSDVNEEVRQNACGQAAKWVEAMRAQKAQSLMDIFMSEYGLSNSEGIALMCLAEALLRVPDSQTIDALIEDKIAPSDWAAHLGRSSSPLVNASTWALMLTGRVLDEEKPLAGVLTGAIRRVGEPVIRKAVKRAMQELGAQFVLGQNIDEAIKNGRAARKKNYTFSYDMLGEAARTADDALGYFNAYANAINVISRHCHSEDARQNPGISIKLSALYERYELPQRERVMKHLVPRVLLLAQMAKKANMGLNIDAEEAARLELSMDVIEAVLLDRSLAGWNGFGIVVQAYGKRARFVIEWYAKLAEKLDRKVMLRLVKGAYWDTEIKVAQVNGQSGFPVFTSKPATDVSYIENAAFLLANAERIYPQFATHNAHTVAAICALAGDFRGFEFQRLHGMGEGLYDIVRAENEYQCRIYAPVGIHEDLLAYLVRRLLENGANSSFVNQMLDADTPAEVVASDPYIEISGAPDERIVHPSALFAPRVNSRGWDLFDVDDFQEIISARAPFEARTWHAFPILAAPFEGGELVEVVNPASGSKVGTLQMATSADAKAVVAAARKWDESAGARAKILRNAADIYEQNFGEIFALLTKESGKTSLDAIAELREAVDFLRYYADEAEKHRAEARGVFACISPWNFPLAIFTGQIAAALAAGNGVIAKPAEATSMIAWRAVSWLHEAGVPQTALQYLPGTGRELGDALISDPRIDGVCFTGSTTTAQMINRQMAKHLDPSAMLIAETGGLNAMIVDSTALPEQAVGDIVISAFQSAGQRCSACRILFVQEDVAERTLKMLFGAMDALQLGDPWYMDTDVGPVIDARAQAGIKEWIEKQRAQGNILKEVLAPNSGTFVAPTVIELNNISELEREIFGPVLHVIRYRSEELEDIIAQINDTGFGLTFGIHSRIDDRVELACKRIHAGNIYVNRNQIGAIVGSQPFGGHGLSGTGPKAGGPLYLHRFYKNSDFSQLAKTERLPGPTGESNQWAREVRGRVLCLGPAADEAEAQAKIVQREGAEAIVNVELNPELITELQDIDAVVAWGGDLKAIRNALALRTGAIIPLITSQDIAPYLWLERHICVDTTASGGNAELLAG